MVGLDVSAGMLAEAAGLPRVRGSARRLPFGRGSFDAAMAVEVFEHLAAEAIDRVCGEVLRVLEPGGTFVVIDKNACSLQRPSSLAAERGGEVDRRAPRSVDVRARRTGARALVPAAGAQAPAAAGGFRRCESGICSRAAKRAGFHFSGCRRARLLVLVGGEGAGGAVVTELYSQRLASLPLLLWKTPPGLELILAQEGVPFETVKDPHPLVVPGGAVRALRRSERGAASSIQPLLGRTHVLIDVDDFRRGETPDPFAALVDHRAALGSWTFGGFTVSERVARYRQGLASPAVDRPASRRGDRRGRRLDADFAVSLPLSIGVQLPG